MLLSIVALGLGRIVCAVDLPDRPDWWEGVGDPMSLELELVRTVLAQAPAAERPRVEGEAPAKPAFAAANTWRWYIQGSWAFEVSKSSNEFVMLGGGVNYFLVNGLSLGVELNAMYVIQDGGDDAVGVNFAMLLRWHFLLHERWTMYADGGAGLLGTTERVPGPMVSEPRGGTRFNFTPQAGLGFTFALNDEARLFAGVRWYHISNANTQENNPGRDSIMIYGGMSFPF